METEKLVIYISGKITGLTQPEVEKSFNNAETELISFYPQAKIVNPIKVEHNHDKTWENYMKQDLKAMMDCNAIYMLPNWEDSEGAKIEHRLASQLGYKIIYKQ